MTLRIGIDVGGTSTDVVVVEGATLVASAKVATSADPGAGIENALAAVVGGVDRDAISRAMLGTTQPANAIIARSGLRRVAVLRLAAPAALAVPPAAGWPASLRAEILGPTAVVEGGHEHDGREIAPLDREAIRAFARQAAGRVAAVAIAGAFAPVNRDHEQEAAALVAEVLGDGTPIACSAQIGTVGLLERENATILNAALTGVARDVVEGFSRALERQGLTAEPYLTQNDGTLMTAEEAVRWPVLTVASGPTNSMRGASELVEVGDALVVDVGGTSTDMGALTDGFPRTSAAPVVVGGVRTNFRMPDLVSVALGGGTIVHGQGAAATVGPQSVGHEVLRESLLGGGSTTTLSDVSARLGRETGFGDPPRVRRLDRDTATAAMTWVERQIRQMSERLKPAYTPLPLIAVGGGAHLVPDEVPGVTEVIRPRHQAVANAFGAAVAEAAGSVDRIYHYDLRGRDQCLDEAKQLAVDAAVRAGADPARVRITTISEVPMGYLPGGGFRVQVKAAGGLAG